MKKNTNQQEADHQFVLASNAADFLRIANLASVIWSEHYTSIIGQQQVGYMLDKYQSSTAIEAQIKQGAVYYLLLHEKADAGYFSYSKKNGLLFLSKLYVLKALRGKGFGKKALAYIEGKAKELDCSKISLTVNKYNTNAIKAYEKMGFKTVEAIVQDIGNGYVMDDYVMEKEI